MNRSVPAAGFILLCLGLVLLARPVFFNPPHVDYWEAFFTFHQVRSDPDLGVWPYVANHDPWRHGTFRPLSYTTLYYQHRVFGGRFFLNQVSNFLVYCLLLALLYGLGRKLGARPLELGGFLAVFSVLYSHVDVLALSFHVFLLAGFAGSAGGFCLYLRYLETFRARLLVLAGLAFLFSLLCYEPFLLWPPAVLILMVSRPREGPVKTEVRPTLILLGAVYLAYGGVFLLTRTAHHVSGEFSPPAPSALVQGLALAFFNFFYTGLGINLVPALAYSERAQAYSEMWGPVSPWSSPSTSLLAAATIAGLLLFGLLVFILRRRGDRAGPAAAAFLGFLYLTFFAVLAAARSSTAGAGHVLNQFRYQLVPNALLALLAAVAFSVLLPPGGKKRAALFILLAAVFCFNAFHTRRHLEHVGRSLSPLRDLLAAVRTGLDRGEITREHSLYLPDGLASTFPPLCWMPRMGRKMWGTYQWVFSPDELAAFTPDPVSAAWIALGEPPWYRPAAGAEPLPEGSRQ